MPARRQGRFHRQFQWWWYIRVLANNFHPLPVPDKPDQPVVERIGDPVRPVCGNGRLVRPAQCGRHRDDRRVEGTACGEQRQAIVFAVGHDHSAVRQHDGSTREDEAAVA